MIAIARASETYDTLKTSFSEIIQEVNKLNDEKRIYVNGRNVEVEILIGGDYQVW